MSLSEQDKQSMRNYLLRGPDDADDVVRSMLEDGVIEDEGEEKQQDAEEFVERCLTRARKALEEVE